MYRRYKFILDLLNSLNLSVKGKTVIDCGCGDGDGSKLLQDRGANLIAIDLSKREVNKCQKLAIKNVQKGDIRCLDFNDNFCDYFFSSETLEHLTKTDGQKAAQEIQRITRFYGIVCITVPEYRDVCLANPNHKNYVNECDLKEWFNLCEVVLSSRFIKKKSKPRRSNLVMIFRVKFKKR